MAANLTSDRSAGIGGWTDREITRAIAHGVSRDGHGLKPPMAFGYYAGLKESDLADIIAYLRTFRRCNKAIPIGWYQDRPEGVILGV
jgi:hypothetical protein